MITQKYLKEKLSYNPDNGLFTWNLKQLKGKLAGCPDNGYIRIRIDGKLYMAHRLAWLYVYGEFPSLEVDHINHDRSDNRICNLRNVEHKQNLRNQTRAINNKSGVTGVHWDKRTESWKVEVKVDGINLFVGRYRSFSDAVDARAEANLIYGFHDNHGAGKQFSGKLV